MRNKVEILAFGVWGLRRRLLSALLGVLRKGTWPCSSMDLTRRQLFENSWWSVFDVNKTVISEIFFLWDWRRQWRVVQKVAVSENAFHIVVEFQQKLNRRILQSYYCTRIFSVMWWDIGGAVKIRVFWTKTLPFLLPGGLILKFSETQSYVA